jgi:octaprenyl-diphosphate synthase
MKMERVSDTLIQSKLVDVGPGDAGLFATDAALRSPFSREAALALQQLLERELADLEEQLTRELQSDYAAVNRVMKSAAALQGKRLRPRLVLLGALACGGITPNTRRIAAVVELVHAATLVHDDVLDNADTRRGAPASHVTWGNRNSILLGDVLFSKACVLAAGAGSCFVADRVGRAGLALCQGELRQQDTIGAWSLSIDEYIDILRQKTGDLCAASSMLGGWSASADDATMRALESYGLQLGIAFQIYDDWLDVWGSAALGKPLGNDVANRKPTLPALRLLEQTPPEARPALIALLEQGQMCQQLRDAFDASDASAVTLDTARRYAEEACNALACLPDSPARLALVGVAQQSVRRSR